MLITLNSFLLLKILKCITFPQYSAVWPFYAIAWFANFVPNAKIVVFVGKDTKNADKNHTARVHKLSYKDVFGNVLR